MAEESEERRGVSASTHEQSCGPGLRALGEAAQALAVVGATLWLGAVGAWLGG